MLNNTNKKSPFSVPENYFQNFNSEIMNHLPEKQVDKSKKIVPFWRPLTKWAAVAAVISGVALFGMDYMNSNTNDSVNAIYADDQNENSIENEYYEFLQNEAIRVAYSDAFFSDEL